MLSAEHVLRKAADIIRQRGWTQRESEDPEGRVCMSHAIDLAGDNASARSILKDVIGTNDTVAFNDYCCKSSDDAIAALLIAADLAAPSP